MSYYKEYIGLTLPQRVKGYLLYYEEPECIKGHQETQRAPEVPPNRVFQNLTHRATRVYGVVDAVYVGK